MTDQKNNSGNWNTGYCNSGNWNTGNRNTGDWNTGDWNSGNWNTGYCNSGNWNTGNRNTGDRNSGNCNSGDWNSGNWNTGYCNSGNWNTGNRNTGYCNSDTPKVRLFNKDSSLDFDSPIISNFYNAICRYQRPLCEWVSETNMTDKEKIEHPTHKTTGGYLKVNEKLFNGKDITPEDKKLFEEMPNFDAEIFLKCTGIDITNTKKKITVDGKDIFITKETFEDIKRQFMKE